MDEQNTDIFTKEDGGFLQNIGTEKEIETGFSVQKIRKQTGLRSALSLRQPAVQDAQVAPEVRPEPCDEAAAPTPSGDARLGLGVHIAIGKTVLVRIAGVGEGEPSDLVSA